MAGHAQYQLISELYLPSHSLNVISVETNAFKLTYWWFFRPSAYAGHHAERTFKKIVVHAGYVAEPLSQTRESFRESLRALGPGKNVRISLFAVVVFKLQ